MPQKSKYELFSPDESDSPTVELPFHRPLYDPRENILTYLIQAYGSDLLKNVPIRGSRSSPSHIAKSSQLSTLAEVPTIFFRPEQGRGGRTHMYFSEERSVLKHAARLLTTDVIRAKLDEITYKRACQLARVNQKDLRIRTLRASLELAHHAAETVDPNLSNLFSNIFLSDYMAARKSPESAKATITDLAGVYSHLRPLAKPEQELSTPTHPYRQLQRTAAVAIELFLHNQARTGGHYHESEYVFHPERLINPKRQIPALSQQELTQLGNTPQQLQQDAVQLHAQIVAENGWQNMLPNNPSLAIELDTITHQSEFVDELNSAPTPPTDQSIIMEVSPYDSNSARFKHRNLRLSPTENGLRGIPLRIINQDGTHFRDIDALSFLSLSEEQLKSHMETTNISADDPQWRPLDSVIDEKNKGNWPLFCFSLSKDVNLPPKVAANLSSRGSSMLYFDFRPNPDGTMQFWVHPSHAVIDATGVETYLNLLGRVLPYTNDHPPSTLTLHRAPLYDTESNPNHWEGYQRLFNDTGHADAVVGLAYPAQQIDELIKQISPFIDQGTSDQIRANFNSLFVGDQAIQNLNNFRNYLVDHYPQELQARFELHNAQLDRPPAQTDRELLLDLIYECIKQPGMVSKLRLADKIVSTLNHKPGFINLYDAIVAAESGVLNCVLPIFKHKRLVLAAVQGFDTQVMDSVHHYQSLSSEEKQRYHLPPTVFTSALDTLDLNITEQGFAGFGISVPNHLANKVGSTKSSIEGAGGVLSSEIARISSEVGHQTSSISTSSRPSLDQVFVTAGSQFNRHLAVEHGNVVRPDGTGFMTSRYDLVKSSRTINHLDLNEAITILENNPECTKMIKVLANPIRVNIGKLKNHQIFNTISKIVDQKDETTKEEMLRAIGTILDTAMHLKLQKQLADTQALAELLARGPATH